MNRMLYNTGIVVQNPLQIGTLVIAPMSKRIAYKVDNPLWLKAYVGYVLVTILVMLSVFGPIILGTGLMLWLATFGYVSTLSSAMMGIVIAQATCLFTMISWDLYERLPSTKRVLTKYRYE